jgi:hypothetical protein
MRRKFAVLGALAAFVGVSLGGSTLAGADELTPSTDTVVVAPVASVNVGITLVATTGEWGGDHGCNLKNEQNDPGHFLDASVTSDNTAVATVDQATLHYTGCGDTEFFNITGVSCGTATITVAHAADRSSGGANAVFSEGSIAVTVTGCDGPPTGIEDCAHPAAPAWAAAILQGNGVKGSNKSYSKLISSVAQTMLQGAAFPSGSDVIAKDQSAGYSTAVWEYMKAQNLANNYKLNLAKGPAEVARPGWECNFTPAV